MTLTKTLIGERTIVGLRPEIIALADGFLTAVRSACMHHRQRLDGEEGKETTKIKIR